ncbi:MAG: hypothetical protein R3C99_21800 [Pirellulaceae bacterium]
MEQLKPILAGIKKHHFWILSTLVVLMAIGVWFMVTGKLKKDTESQVTLVKGQFSSINSLKNERPLPNDASHQQMDQVIAQTTRSLYEAWESLYSQQRDVLVWSPELTDEFVAAVDPLRPIEKAVPYNAGSTPPTDPKDEIAPRFRELYQNYVENLFPHLAEIVQAKWTAKRDAGGAGGMGSMPGYGSYGEGGGDPYAGAAMPGGAGVTGAQPLVVEKPPVVNWSTQNQSEIINTHFNWKQKPSTLEVLYAQETLWVLEAILRIIARTNGDIDARYQAAIKDIEQIQLGRPATGKRGQITSLMPMGMGNGMIPGEGSYSSEGMMPSSEGMMSQEGSYSPEGGMPGMPGMPGAGGAAAIRDPAEGRYVDEKYEMLTAERLRGAIASDSIDPSNAPIVVAKRMPVLLRLTMDQRKLSRFLAECGNAELPLEVRQVRVNPKAGGSAMGGMGGGMGIPGMGGGSGMIPGAGMGEGSYGSSEGSAMPGYGQSGYGSGDASARVVSSSSPYDVPVEISGIVYIYNPVSIEKLGIDKVQTGDELNQTPTEPDATTTPDTTPDTAPPPAAAPVDPAVAPVAPADPAAVDPAAAAPVAPVDPAAAAPVAPAPVAPAPGQ